MDIKCQECGKEISSEHDEEHYRITCTMVHGEHEEELDNFIVCSTCCHGKYAILIPDEIGDRR